MPTYEYHCKKCDDDFEVVQSFNDTPLKVCPKCGSEVHRVITGGSGVIFKGSGFYSTDTALAKKSTEKSDAPVAAPAKTACTSCPHAQGSTPPPCATQT
ncbi:MAG: zinc ribbon domain-containing protein [Termitinemataceae bacterium]|nr:MAG: zinc ribbon domain-containing protein [Termitinemataceae bacterium]